MLSNSLCAIDRENWSPHFTVWHIDLFPAVFDSPGCPFMSIFMSHLREKQVENGLLPSSDINTWVALIDLLKMPHFISQETFPDVVGFQSAFNIYIDMILSCLSVWIMNSIWKYVSPCPETRLWSEDYYQ